uniref:Uncharacterized protein n=1 Tax=Spongospora subterranea TaxID=70186 RepID=A0A0H5QGG7_9EUKA|eukprot:CRZ00692.1 hypothetical protein [Spongospora subterranea]
MRQINHRFGIKEKFASSNGLLTEQELDIGSKCEAILIKSFPQLLGDHEFLSDMRTVLAFLDAESMPIHATAFYFIFPALFAYRRGPEKRSDALTDIVEHMAALERANYVLTLVDQQMFTTFVIRLDADLKAKDPELYKVIERVSIERRSVGSSASGKLSSYSAGIRSYAVVSGLEDALDELCQYNFIRVCSIPVMMYVWDQLILSRWEALPRLSVVFLVCLRKPLLKCTSALAFCQVISRLGPHLQLGSLQRSMTVLYSIQRPHSLFDGPGTIFSATAFPGNKVEGFNLSGLGKFDDEYEQHQSRIEDIMKLWKKRSRQLAYWVMFIRARSIIHATASPDKPIT